ncbi:MAG: hypothetical protein NZM40_05495 [Sphingomonadaceae bacterium]|uniref:hypothetical protein n=1 Tax=Thermaurantiacus sp. TaxID=2820283 RepID=UPI00298EEBC2|nr:hypothetical protein [Thermaurantiacus sp.]MCS6986871.1 hypothetical protein [Sphingomonadaceae bacterium]MDW8415529.1 hypothetical protein [Thermaurantiacus sp.]
MAGASAPLAGAVVGALMAAPLGAAPPPLRVFAPGFEPGLWAVEPARPGGPAERRCLADPGTLLFVGPPPAPACRILVHEDRADRAAVGWSCPDGESGRSEVRRDHAGLYVAQGQGVRDGRPWAAHREYRRLGPCPR